MILIWIDGEKNNPKKFFKENINFENLKTEFENFSVPQKTKKSSLDLDEKKIKSTIQNMNIAYINYQFLKNYFQNILETKNLKNSQKKLMTGLVNELLERKLVI